MRNTFAFTITFPEAGADRPLRHARAFTLIEMLVVITIISILMTVATPFVSSTMQASRLTSAGDNLLFKISAAVQVASTENRPVELRFYCYDDGRTNGCHAFQLFYYNSVSNESKPMEPAAMFGEDSVVMPTGTLSPIFSGHEAESTGTADMEPFKTKGATYRRIIFYPNGTTSLEIPLRDSFMTLMGVTDASKDDSKTPPNYYIIQMDPVTGRAKSYRP